MRIIAVLFVLFACKSKSVIVQTETLPGFVTYEEYLRASQHVELSPADHSLFRDCAENSGTIDPNTMGAGFAEFSYLKPAPGFRQFRTELNGWPFITSVKNARHEAKDYPVLLALRGEGSAFHRSYLTRPLIKFSGYCPECTLVLSDEFVYHDGPDNKGRLLTPLCHRRRYKNNYIGPETPGLQHGGAGEYLKRVVPPGSQVIIISYSNATTPRGEFLSREPINGELRIDKSKADTDKMLRNYLISTRPTYRKNREIVGFIDIEGNFEGGPPLLNLLAYLLTEVETNPQRFYYSAVRVEKSDAFPVQVAMIRALRLTGQETEEGVIRFTNQKKNIIIDVIETPYAPHYVNVGIDLRKDTAFAPYTRNAVKRKQVGHLQMPEWVLTRLGNERKIMTYFAARPGMI